MIKKLFLFALGALACQAGNIVLNPGFESGSTDWTLVNFAVGGAPHTGVNSVGTGCGGPNCVVPGNGSQAFILQNLVTVASQTYTLSFWEAEAGPATSEMAIYWNGNLVQDILNPNNSAGTPGNIDAYVQFTFPNLVATSTSTTLQIFGRQDPNEIVFDDFDGETSAASVPEPGTFALLGLGLAGAIWMRRQVEAFSPGLACHSAFSASAGSTAEARRAGK